VAHNIVYGFFLGCNSSLPSLREGPGMGAKRKETFGKEKQKS